MVAAIHFAVLAVPLALGFQFLDGKVVQVKRAAYMDEVGIMSGFDETESADGIFSTAGDLRSEIAAPAKQAEAGNQDSIALLEARVAGGGSEASSNNAALDEISAEQSSERVTLDQIGVEQMASNGALSVGEVSQQSADGMSGTASNFRKEIAAPAKQSEIRDSADLQLPEAALPPPPPIKAGCYVWLPRGCRKHRFHAKLHWRQDMWGEVNMRAGDSSAACSARKRAFKEWCQVEDVVMLHVATDAQDRQYRYKASTLVAEEEEELEEAAPLSEDMLAAPEARQGTDAARMANLTGSHGAPHAILIGRADSHEAQASDAQADYLYGKMLAVAEASREARASEGEVDFLYGKMLAAPKERDAAVASETQTP